MISEVPISGVRHFAPKPPPGPPAAGVDPEVPGPLRAQDLVQKAVQTNMYIYIYIYIYTYIGVYTYIHIYIYIYI